MADWLDDLLGGVNKIAQDVLPWYGVGEDIADLFGTNKLGKAPRLPPIRARAARARARRRTGNRTSAPLPRAAGSVARPAPGIRSSDKETTQ